MDEKTRRLRDIFMDVAADATLTERQEQTRGSLARAEVSDEQLRAVIERLSARDGFDTALSTADLVRVVRGFYDGASDTEIARNIDDEPSREAVARARLALHLVRERDLDAPFELSDLRRASDRPAAAVAEELGVSESTVRRYRRVLAAQRDRRAVGDRYREEFDRLLADRDLGERLTAEAKRTGLEDATEDMESNVSF